ncbi:MAG: hypothetical protein A3G34_02065 [Candidatus Lindowbacteria bacterium RIFCSPLOWO2_12_FULL_62_27]|nr:MAG: hypothetical protein A3I06_11585 [Candidatus Lindowbacteria bacterium RIFCSPLOWO2_02_FULL_62_12]OGH59091.1 MAG: hypothetical protein A3G34_02065 [Candidatus Lindowbacteria bacterium RIFCSPLOWO2_12_FULL_62_27]
MGHRTWIYIGLILLIANPAFAKVKDFQFIEDLSFAMPGEISVTQGLNKAEVRRLASKTLIDEGIWAQTTNTLKAKSIVPTHLTYGVSERFELSLEVPYVFLDNAVTDFDGIGDVVLQQKLRVSDQAGGRRWLSSAFGMRVEPPTGDASKGIGNGKTDVEFFGVGMKEIGFTKWLVNVGYNFVGGERYGNELKYNGGVNASIRPGVSFLMEFNGIAGTKNEVYLAPGFLIETRGISFRVGTQFGMSDDSYKYRWNFNLSNSF